MGKYKMLVLDMDDTLLTDDHQISIKNKESLKKAQEKGVYVVLASGRPTPAMTSYAKELNLIENGSFMISFNGAIVTDLKANQDIFEKSLTKEEIHSLYDFSVLHKVHIITYLDDCIISETDSEYIEVEKKLTGLPHKKVSNFKDAVDRSAVKCLMLEEPGYLKTVSEKLKLARPNMFVSISKPYFLEVVPDGVDKAKSLEFLANHLGIKREEIIAVGNAGNDLTMIEYAGLGVWVDNVTPELRDRADVIVASNNDDGVSEVVERYLL
jgi:Cof subfamily protein (haloacid dehalogenase superfamily)